MSILNYSKDLTILLEVLRELQEPNSIDTLMQERIYVKQEQRDFFTKLGLFYTGTSKKIVKELDNRNLLNIARTYGLVNKNDYFILANRCIVPVYNINKHLVSLIGWAKEWHDTKYITLPSPYLNKNLDWFALPYALEEYTNYIVVVEGIFDALTLNSIGIPTVATMGSDVTYSKTFLLQAFGRVLYLPDNDRVGKTAIDNWKFKGSKATALDLRGKIQFSEETDPIPIKDGDDLGSYLNSQELRELFQEIANSSRLKVLINLSSEDEIRI